MPLSRVASSTLWQIASQATMAALSIFSMKLIAIGLSKELAGIHNSAFGYLQVFGIIADFGLYATAVREVSRTQNPEKTLGAVLTLRTCILLISLSAALLFAWTSPSWRNSPLPLAITIASTIPLFTLLAGTLRVIFQVKYRMHYIFVAEVAQRVLTVSLIALIVLGLGIRGTPDTTILFTILAVGGTGAFLLLILSYTYSRKLLPIHLEWNHSLLVDLFRKALPFGLAYLCITLYRQTDVTLIALLRPDFELQNAYYGFVLRMTDMAFLIPTFLLNSVLPLLKNDGDERTEILLGKTLLSLLLIGSVLFLFSFLWPTPLTRLLTTEAYLSTAFTTGSDTALLLLALPMFLNGLILFSFYILLATHAWKPLVGILAIGAALSIALNMWLIPMFGFTGAAVTSIVVHVLLAGLLLPLSLASIRINFPWCYTLRWCAFVLSTSLLLLFIRPILVNEWATLAGLGIAAVGIVMISFLLGLFPLFATSTHFPSETP